MSNEVQAQKVRVILRMCGDYCAFHECSVYLAYDITNDVQLDEETLEEIKENIANDDGDGCDYQECDAVIVDGRYYYNF